jgi:hypothetical protein
MPVKNIECQIAEAQIARLLAGDSFSNEVLAELEDHIASCDGCRAHVSGKMVEEAPPETPVLEPEVRTPRPSINLLQAQFRPLLDDEPEAVEDPTPAPKPKAKPKPAGTQAVVQTPMQMPNAQNFWKPLAYSGALAVVLFAMSYLMKNPTAVFGEKAAAAVPAGPVEAKPKETNSTQPASTTPPEAPAPAEEPQFSVLLNGRTDTSEPVERPMATSVPVSAAPAEPTPRETTVSTPQSKPQPKPAAKPAPKAAKKPAVPKPKPRRKGGSLRFYDSEGRPLN